jgi:hypothetical protein
MQFVFLGHERRWVWRIAHYKRLECSQSIYCWGDRHKRALTLSTLHFKWRFASNQNGRKHNRLLLLLRIAFHQLQILQVVISRRTRVSPFLCVHLLRAQLSPKTQLSADWERELEREPKRREQLVKNPNIETRFPYYACLGGILIFIACYFYVKGAAARSSLLVSGGESLPLHILCAV